MHRTLGVILVFVFSVQSVSAGLAVVRSNGITLTGADGIQYISPSGITLTGADNFLTYRSNGITLTGADGVTLTGADGYTSTGTSSVTYTGPNGITLTGADGITLTGADGITLTGADGVTLTGADGTTYTADSLIFRGPTGITLTGADGITLTGADGVSVNGPTGITQTGIDGVTLTGADGITLTGADGITLTGADGITLTGADSVTGMGPNGVIFEQVAPTGITLTGADGITLTGADGITLTGADGVTLTGVDGISNPDSSAGFQSLDPDLALTLNSISDDSSVNAVVVYHNQVTESDISQLRQLGILGGTRFRVIPAVYVTATRSQIIAISQLPAVRSIYGNRTLNFDADPYFKVTGIERVPVDPDLLSENNSLPFNGRNVTVAVLDTGINAGHPDLAGKVVQNVRLIDAQSGPVGFNYPAPIENLSNTDAVGGHGTFVAGIIAGSGGASNGKFAGVAPGARLLGLSAGDMNLTHVLAGFDYILEKGPAYGVKILNCSFSAATVFDVNDPVNIATRMLTDRGVSVVFSAGNSGAGNGTLNPYAAAPWVIGVGATDQNGLLAAFSSRGNFGDPIQHPAVVAPGVNVAAPRAAGTISGTTGFGGADLSRLTATELSQYTTGSGTSFSAPQVAGAIALMLEARPELRPAEIRDIISRTATPLPRYFYHETGAGMLNTHAAVLEAAFPERSLGDFRNVLSGNTVRFVTSVTQNFAEMVVPNTSSAIAVNVPGNTVQLNIKIGWGLSTNDFGLRVVDQNNELVAASNALNLPGLTGRQEKVALRAPTAQTLQAAVRHTGGIGFAQNVHGSVEITRVIYPDLQDLGSLSPAMLSDAQGSLLTSIMMPQGHRFRPSATVSRLELSSAMLRAGLVPQYVAGSALYSDVRDRWSRNGVESVQSAPLGRLIYDSEPGGRFYPNSGATRLVSAVAFVRAANLESSVSSTFLPANVTDAASIPSELRGYVAVALQHGFLQLDGNSFAPQRSITRIELAHALNSLIAR